MKELIISPSSTLADFEAYLALPDLGGRTLVLSSKLLSNAGSLGTSLSYTQFILTWARRAVTPVVKIDLAEGDEDNYLRLVQRAHGLGVAYYAGQVISDKGFGADIRYSLLKTAAPRIQAMHRGQLLETARGSEIEMVFIEGAQNEFHGSLYSKAPTTAELADNEKHGELIRPRIEANRFIEECLKTFSWDRKLCDYIRSSETPFGSLLSEAFRNTAEHGYRNADGSKLKGNMRCVRIAKSLVSRDWIKNFKMGSPDSTEAAQKYFDVLSQKKGAFEKAQMQFLEFSIFDSGAGFSKTMGESLKGTPHTDVELVAKCFDKHKSSKSGGASGRGLSRILSAVHKLGGFVRFRTSTAEAFFAASEDFSPDMAPSDFVSGNMPHAEGTLITVGIPVIF
tara:strand:- start:3304 stop:4488 length:1185 start_codon:yes stop_codon:yes gene_type:complete